MKNEFDVIATVFQKTGAVMITLTYTRFIKYQIIFLSIKFEKLVISWEGSLYTFIRKLQNCF